MYFDEKSGFRALTLSVNCDSFRFRGYMGRFEDDNLTRPIIDYTMEYSITELYSRMKALFTNFPALWSNNIDRGAWNDIRIMIL
jgi:hypothetical protein